MNIEIKYNARTEIIDVVVNGQQFALRSAHVTKRAFLVGLILAKALKGNTDYLAYEAPRNSWAATLLQGVKEKEPAWWTGGLLNTKHKGKPFLFGGSSATGWFTVTFNETAEWSLSNISVLDPSTPITDQQQLLRLAEKLEAQQAHWKNKIIPMHRGILAEIVLAGNLNPRPKSSQAEPSYPREISQQEDELGKAVERSRLKSEICNDNKFMQHIPSKERTAAIANFLCCRYRVDENDELFSYQDDRYCPNKIILPIATLWRTTEQVDPDSVLDKILDLGEKTYRVPEDELNFMEDEDKMKRNGSRYRMVEFHADKNCLPRIKGGIGTWYEHQLTDHSLRWELFKADLENCDWNGKPELKRRQRFEEKKVEESLRFARRRCAAMGITTLLAIKMEDKHYECLLPKRSKEVMVYPEAYGLAPAGGFECTSPDDHPEDEWSIRMSLLREFMEEILDDKEEQAPKRPWPKDIRYKPAYDKIIAWVNDKKARLSMTAFSIDLTSLTPEISTILVLDHEQFSALQPKGLCWEFAAGKKRLDLDWKSIGQKFHEDGQMIIPPAAAALIQGMRWLEAQRLL